MNFEEFKERFQKVPVEEYPNRVRKAMPEPMVSVRITTYQHANYIRESIESVLMQKTGFPVEIVIGDDESTDGTREICIEYAEKYPQRIRLMLHRRENNIHLNGRPTHLFQYAHNTFSLRGKYIAGVSGDDYWTDPKKLQKQMDFLEANPDYVLSHHNAKVVNQEGKVFKESILSEKDQRDFSPYEVSTGSWILTLTILYRNILQELPPEFFKCLNEDAFLTSLLGLHGPSKYQSDIAPAAYRVHDTSIWSSTDRLEQSDQHLNTFLWLSEYHSRINNEEIATYFEHRAVKELYRQLDVYIRSRDVKGVLRLVLTIAIQHIRESEWQKVFLPVKIIIQRIFEYAS